MKRELGIARCGMACCLCCENITCKGCRKEGFLELSWCKDAQWCENRNCGIAKGINGCYECTPADCRKGLYAEKLSVRGFAEYGTNKPGLFITGKTSRETMTALTTWTS